MQDAINNNAAGSIIQLKSDLVTTSSITISKSVTVDGQGYVINPNFNKTSNSNNATLNIIANNVNIKNLIIDGSNGTDLHGINVYTVTSVNIDNVTIKNNDRDGLVVNGSSVAVNNIFTSNNGWGGIDVDQGSGVATPASLTVNGKSVHSETAEDIIVDDTTKNVSVNDTQNQYNVTVFGNKKVYLIQPDAPTITTPTSEQYFKTSPILDSWTAVSYKRGLSKYQIEYIYDDGHTFSGGPYREVSSTQTSRLHSPSLTEQGGVTIRVRAVDTYGNYGKWSNSVHYFYDSVAPATPYLISPLSNIIMNGKSITQSWADTSSDVKYYIYESYNDSAATSLRWHQELSATSKTATNVSDADYWWRVKAVDNAGNESAWSDLWKITVDNTAPSVPTMNFSANGKSIVTNGYTTLKNFKFDLTSSSDATRYQLKYWNDITGSRFKESTPWSPTNLSSYSSSLGVYNDQFTQGEGTHYFSFSACDAANNCSEYSSPFVVTYDKTAPVATIISPSDSYVVSGNVVIRGSINDNNPDHYYLVIKDSDGKVVAGPGVVYKDNVQDWTWDTTKIADGTYTIDLEARDKAGNKSSSSVTTVNVVVDNVKPTINYESYTQLNNAITPEITASDYSSFSWTADPLNPAGATFDDTKIAPTFSVINNGTYKFTLKVTDDQGSSVSYAFEFTYTKPVEAVTSGLTSGTTTSFTNVTATPVSSTASTDADTTGEVLGAQTKTDDSNKNSQASKVASVEDSNIWSILGLAWYWWLLIIAAILLLWRIIVAIVKNKKQEENTN